MRYKNQIKVIAHAGRGKKGMKHILFGKIAVIALMTFAIVTLTTARFAGGTVLAGSVDANVDQSTSLRLADTGHIRPQVKAFARLQLHVDQAAGPSLRVAGQAESDGLTENGLYGLWVTTREGNSILVDTGRADEECDTGDCEKIVDLRGHLLEAPANLTTLEGLTISIRDHSNPGLLSNGAPVVATGTVGAPDLTGEFGTSYRPTVDTNIANTLGDLPDSAANIRSSAMRLTVGASIRPRSDGDDDDETRADDDDNEQDQEGG